MTMTPREAVLEFLAQRAPAAFPLHIIQRRVESSGLIDEPIDTLSELTTLASERMGHLVDATIAPISMEPHWFATPEGVRQWTLNGGFPQ